MTDDLNAEGSGQQTDANPDVKDDVVVKDSEAVETDSIKEFGDYETKEDLLKGHEELKANQPVVPEDLEDYTFDVVEGVEVSEDIVSEFKEVSQKLGLTAAQYKGVVEYEFEKVQQFNKNAPEREQAEVDASKVKADEVIAARKEEYGVNFEKMTSFQQKACSDFGVGDLVNDPSIANNDMFFKFAAKVGEALSEQKINSGDGKMANQNPVDPDTGAPMLKHKDTDKL